jgi:signal transduction histidine kinase
MLGYKGNEVIGKPIAMLLYQPDALLKQDTVWSEDGGQEINRSLNLLSVKLSGAGPTNREWIYRHQNGKPVRVRVDITALSNVNHTCKGYLLIAQDISEQSSQKHLMDQFIAMINRLIAEPLMRIHEALELLRDNQPDMPEAEIHVIRNKAQTECKRLLEVSHNLFELEQIQQNRLVFNMRPLALGPQLEQAVQINSAYVQSHAVQLDLQSDDYEAVVIMDEQRFQQIMKTLLSQVVMSSSPGERITIKTELQSSRIRILISGQHADNTALSNSQVSDQFTLHDLLNLSAESGPQLSLQISKSLIEPMGGKIGHEQIPDGICLWIELPRAMQIKQART